MEGKEWVLVSRTDENLYVALTTKNTGRGRQRTAWEWTTSFSAAAGFDNAREIDLAYQKHRIPVTMVRLKNYTTAHLTWTRTLAANTTTGTGG